MTTTAHTLPSPRLDPRYNEGLKHLQQGEWAQAIATFETLEEEYPESPAIIRALEQARLRSELESGRKIRGRLVAVRLWPLLLRVAVIGLLGLLVYLGGQLLIGTVRPMIEQAQENRRLEEVLVEAQAFLESGDLAAAEERFDVILGVRPEHEAAQEGMAQIEAERAFAARYEEAVRLDEAGEEQDALEAYLELAALRPGYRDLRFRIQALEEAKSLEQRLEEANAAYEAGDVSAAIAAYTALREHNLTYEQETVETRLFELYMAAGNAIVEQRPPNLEDLSQALAYYNQALGLRPRSQEAGREQQLLKLFLEGQKAYYEERWLEAATRLRWVYDTRPDYLGGVVLELLYETYIRSGDLYRAAGDNYLAYEQYRKAQNLPVEDTAFADGRLFYVQPLLTPTPTPRPELSGPPPTPQPLSSYRNRIVFKADYPNVGELWVMNPDGTQRQRLGRSAELREEFENLVDQERYAPEGDRFAFAQPVAPHNPLQQLFITIPPEQREGERWFEQLTDLDGDSSHPAWSPDGLRIAFVSDAVDNDDIWIISADGSNAQPLTANPWEWDRHPSWAPESNRIVFWSNRSGLKQIYVMNANGTRVTNISNTRWDEYDPVWVK